MNLASKLVFHKERRSIGGVGFFKAFCTNRSVFTALYMFRNIRTCFEEDDCHGNASLSANGANAVNLLSYCD